jgi:hypothetical protein
MSQAEAMRVIPSEVEGSRDKVLDTIPGFFDSASLRSE